MPTLTVGHYYNSPSIRSPSDLFKDVLHIFSLCKNLHCWSSKFRNPSIGCTSRFERRSPSFSPKVHEDDPHVNPQDSAPSASVMKMLARATMLSFPWGAVQSARRKLQQFCKLAAAIATNSVNCNCDCKDAMHSQEQPQWACCNCLEQLHTTIGKWVYTANQKHR